jgi:hypothetical protein
LSRPSHQSARIVGRFVLVAGLREALQDKKNPGQRPGLKHFTAVLAVKHLLREEKQEMQPCG